MFPMAFPVVPQVAEKLLRLGRGLLAESSLAV